MLKLFYTFFLLITITLLGSCGSNLESNTTFFGGKIINPKTKYVVLFSMDKVIDTLILDKDNKFLGKYSTLNEGLYYFKHGNENQYIYLEPKDSLMLRLNTWDFDESLVYAGKGAERNNILIDIFIENENKRSLYYSFNKLKPEVYQNKMDSIINDRMLTFKDYADKHPNETQNYFNILKTALTYPIYSRIERYSINHINLHNKENHVAINNDAFYKYRKNIRYNNDSLMYYTPYTRYIRNYLYNLTYALGHKPMNGAYSEDFTVDLLKTIDKEIHAENSKNAFLKRTVLDHFYRKSSCNINANTFQTFFKLSSNKNDKLLIEKLVKDNSVIHKGDQIKGFNISDFTDKAINIQDFTLNKNSVLIFWNKKYFSESFLSSRLPYLIASFPDLNFAIIEIDGSSDNRIQKVDIKNQYYINTTALKENFLKSKMPRTILVNKNGIIENGYASLSSKNFFNQLKNFNKNN
ncbi:hypothetical protein [uncultured Polaribacter sp.]|uniref:hypothetical protein n=1 Tax=uncultured Polaribacter sp. TaxID=174711 RepID=UPI002639DE24|nr:hypothetical protein [uncultured Polaribacter sp.]